MWPQTVTPQASQVSASHCVRSSWGWVTRDVLKRHGGQGGETHGKKEVFLHSIDGEELAMVSHFRTCETLVIEVKEK